ncbi:MAG: hypothetical protein MUC56_11220 [Thermoanaerobaculales bacterium]|jgi:hypothetical protein|nr:hypothetical protein [Thermoanaerobaculales bacterium]
MDRSIDIPLDAVLDDDAVLDEEDVLDDEETGAGSGSASAAIGRKIDADSILDSLLPKNIDWRDTVRRYPIGSMLCVGLVGYLVGRTKGAMILSGLTAGLSAAMVRQLSDVFEGDFFDY